MGVKLISFVTKDFAMFAVFPVPVVKEIFWRGLVQPRSESRTRSTRPCFGNIGSFQ